MEKQLEEEIFEALKSIYNNPTNKDQYGQLQKPALGRGTVKSMLSEQAFEYLDTGKSLYGKMSWYNAKFGVYQAVDFKDAFYNRIKPF